MIPGPRRSGNWKDFQAPILVVEVLSKSSRHYDLGKKLDAYIGRAGATAVWIVDHRKREVHVVERGAEGRTQRIERDTLEWHAPGAPEPLIIALPEFFRNALGA